MKKRCFVLVLLLLVLGACSPAVPSATPTVEPTVVAQLHLSELNPASVSVGFSELGKGVNPWTEESLVKGETITIQKTPYPYGLFSHAPAQLEYALSGKYLSLSGKALMHDGLHCGDGVVFRILVGGREVFTSPTLTATSKPVPFSIDLTNAQTLTLNVDALKNNECDWSVWGDPVLTYLTQGSAPIAAGLSPTPTFPEKATSTPTQTPAPTVTPAPSATPQPTATPTEQVGWKPEGVVTRFGKGLFYNLAASPDETTVAIAAAGGIYLADLQTGNTTAFLETGGEPSDLAFSSAGSKLFVGIGDLGVEVWERSGQNTWTKSENYFPSCAYRLLVSPDDKLLVTFCLYSRQNKQMVAWDIQEQKQLWQQKLNLVAKAPLPFGMVFSPNDPGLVAIAANASVSLTNAATGKAQATYLTPKGDLITGLKFSPDGDTLALITGGKAITLLNAQTLTETGKIAHQSEVFGLSFLDNQKLVSINNGEYVLQQTDGRITRKMSAWASPNHVYLPKSGLLALVNLNNLEFISLKDSAIRTVATIPGFIYKYWRSIDFSGDGQAFMGTLSDTNYLLSYANDPDRFKSYNASEVCKSEARWLSFFGNGSQYFQVDCQKADSLKIIDIKTMQTVFSSKSPLWVADNTNIYSNPGPDEAELLGLLYENPAGASAKFSVEIWEPLKNKKISTFDLDLKTSNPWLMFSPHSTLLAGMPRDPDKIQIHEVSTGKLLQTIPDPSTRIEKSKNYYRYEMDDVDLLFFIERQNSVEVYSIQTGKLVRKFSNLGRGQLPEGLSGANPTQGMAYFDETDTLVWYYVKNSSHGQTVNLDYYDVNTGEKRSSSSVEIPLDKQHPYFAEAKAFLGQVTNLYFHPEGQGQTAVVTATLQASNWLRNFILVIDFSKPEIVKTYSYFGNPGTFTPDQTPIVNGFMFQRNFDTIFKWDVSVEK